MANKYLLADTGLRLALVALAAAALSSSPASAEPAIRTIRLNDHPMRIWTAGFESRKPGQPVVVLESGSGSSFEAWKPVFGRLNRLAPTFAYDRSGLGRSEFDGEPPTLEHVAQTLHALLAAARVPGPYVLVGHSWGGEYIRGFASLYPTEVAGLVYLDATDFERTDDEVERERSPERRGVVVGGAPPIPKDPPGARAEMEQIIRYGEAGFADIKAMKVPSTLPVAIVIGAKPGKGSPDSDGPIFKRLQIRHQGEWALASPAGLLLVSTQSGHQVMEDVPLLVIQAVAHVLNASRASRVISK